jgi:NADH dehydrogenase
MAEQTQTPHVVIIGGGFGGLGSGQEARQPAAAVDGHRPDELPPFPTAPLSSGDAALSPADIAAPLRAVLTKHNNVEVMLADVKSIDVTGRKINTGERELSYDYLILATGSRHSYFGNDQWETLAPGLKSLEDAVEIRRRLLMAFEYAEKITDEAARNAAMTFTIIGGGPTGVEMAGAIAEIARYTLRRTSSTSIRRMRASSSSKATSACFRDFPRICRPAR